MAFRGWPVEAVEFYEGLLADNSKTYWTANKATYDEKVRGPMVELLAELEPVYGAGKIFRPYRDVRFSADKTPYKTHLGALLESGGYVQLSADGLACGRGAFHPEADRLRLLREAIADNRSGAELERIVAALGKDGITLVAREQLRTVPRGFDRDKPGQICCATRDLQPGGSGRSARGSARRRRASASSRSPRRPSRCRTGSTATWAEPRRKVDQTVVPMPPSTGITAPVT
ncbi:MAG: DUF2461 domain-containing protein [Frankiales bacterium]|nr:DUF2461 domain-containing protein [Frankiales bacterium]